MARRNSTFQELFMQSMDQASTGARSAADALIKQRQLGVENARADKESTARLGLIGEQTRAAKTGADKDTLDYGKTLSEKTLQDSLRTSAQARDTAQEGTPTPDGRAVDFQAVKGANRGFEKSDAALWNFLNPDKPMGAEGLKVKRTRDEDDAVLASEEKESKASRDAESHKSDMATAATNRTETNARTKLLGAQTQKTENAPTDKGTKLNEAQSKTIGAAGTAKVMLDEIASQFKDSKLGGAGGYAADVVESIPLIGGKLAPKTNEYNDKRRITAETFLREATGAAAPASEVKFYTNLLPEPGDSPEQAQSALNAFRGAVMAKVKGVASTLRAQGKDAPANEIETKMQTLFDSSVNIKEPPATSLGAPAAPADPRVAQAKAAGYTDEEIRAYLGGRK
jgi:hypothetical protein